MGLFSSFFRKLTDSFRGTSVSTKKSWAEPISVAERLEELGRNNYLYKLIQLPVEKAFSKYILSLEEKIDYKFNEQVQNIDREHQISQSFISAVIISILCGVSFILIQSGDPKSEFILGDKVEGIWALNSNECTPVVKHNTLNIQYFNVSFAISGLGYVYSARTHPSKIIIFGATDNRLPVKQRCLGDYLLYPCRTLMKTGPILENFIKTGWIPSKVVRTPISNRKDEAAIHSYLKDGALTSGGIIFNGAKEESDVTVLNSAKLDNDALEPLYDSILMTTGISRDGLHFHRDHLNEWFEYVIKFQDKYSYLLKKILRLVLAGEGISLPKRSKISYPTINQNSLMAQSNVLERFSRALGVLGNYIKVNEVRSKYFGLSPVPNGNKILPIYLAEATAPPEQSNTKQAPNGEAKYNSARLQSETNKNTGIKTGSPVTPQGSKEGA